MSFTEEMFLHRDYIPADPDEQTPAQRQYVEATRSMGTPTRPSEDLFALDYVPGEEAPEDTPVDEKSKVALEAAFRAQERYEAETRERARKHVDEKNTGDLISFMETLGLTDREIYLQEERKGHNRDAIFKKFGQPVNDPAAEEEESEEDPELAEALAAAEAEGMTAPEEENENG